MYLQMLIHSNLPVLLQYPQYLSTLGEISRARVDLDMNSPACCASIRRYWLTSQSYPWCCHREYVNGINFGRDANEDKGYRGLDEV